MQGLNDLGFSVELEAWDPAIRADFDSGPFAQQNLHVGSWGVGVFLGDPAFAYQRWTAGDDFARSYMDNAEMNQLYQDILIEADADNRTAKVHRMQEIAADQVAWIPNTVRHARGCVARGESHQRDLRRDPVQLPVAVQGGACLGVASVAGIRAQGPNRPEARVPASPLRRGPNRPP